MKEESLTYCAMVCYLIPHDKVILVTLPFVHAFFIMNLNSTLIIRKRQGANGQPWWTLRLILKLFVGLPSRLTKAVAFWKSI